MSRRERISEPGTAAGATQGELRAQTCSSLPNGVPMLVAHRGVTGPATYENTMAAFQAAVNLRADFIETDVRRTGDGKLILHHDALLCGTPLCTMTLAEIRAMTALGAPLLTLQELLIFLADRISSRIGLNLELKEAGYEGEVAAMLRDYDPQPGALVVTSFLDDALLRFREHAPHIPCGLLVEEASWQQDFYPEQRLRACGAKFVVAHHSLLHQDFACRLQQAGFPVWVWTVNEPTRLAELLREPGVAAIITDRVARAQTERSLLLHP